MSNQGRKPRQEKKVSKTLILHRVTVQTTFLATISVICAAIIGGLFVSAMALGINQVRIADLYFPESTMLCRDSDGNIAYAGMSALSYQDVNSQFIAYMSIQDPANPVIYYKDIFNGVINSPNQLAAADKTSAFWALRNNLLKAPFTCSPSSGIPSSITSQFPNSVAVTIAALSPLPNNGNTNTVHPIDHAKDNNPSTYYMACNNGQVSQMFNTGGVLVDLGSVVKLSRLELDFRRLIADNINGVNQPTDYPGASPCRYTVKVSEDGINYNQVGARWHPCGPADSTDQSPDAIINLGYGERNARYIKFEHTAINDQTGWCLALNDIKIQKYDK